MEYRLNRINFFHFAIKKQDFSQIAPAGRLEKRIVVMDLRLKI